MREAEAARLMPVKALGGSSKNVLCPMPGVLREVLVRAGQVVKVGEPLALVEAMKMENTIRAERDGTVEQIHARAGDSLAVDAPILDLA